MSHLLTRQLPEAMPAHARILRSSCAGTRARHGVTVDNTGRGLPNRPRRFASLSQAEEENGQSRIYLGIHWAFDKTEGITQSQQVADYVFDRLFTPVGN